jgi:hypothetical protein
VLPPSQAPMLELVVTPVDHPGEPVAVPLLPDPNGGFASGTATLAGAGWWRADLTIVPPEGQPHSVPWWFVLPDPNVSGMGPLPASDPAGRAEFDRAMTTLRELRSVRYTQRLSDGNGSLYQSLNEVTDPAGDRPAAYREYIPDQDTESVIVGDTQWSRLRGGDWTESAAASLYLPSEWWEIYQPGTGFRLGPVEVVDGEPCRIVTFYLPRSDRTAPAWYAWWVGEETGFIRREAMVSQRHYMIYTFIDLNREIRIDPPAERQGPPGAAATPVPAATPQP